MQSKITERSHYIVHPIRLNTHQGYIFKRSLFLILCFYSRRSGFWSAKKKWQILRTSFIFWCCSSGHCAALRKVGILNDVTDLVKFNPLMYAIIKYDIQNVFICDENNNFWEKSLVIMHFICSTMSLLCNCNGLWPKEHTGNIKIQDLLFWSVWIKLK